ncbi:MAG: hypothetical protein F2950_00925 [Actinobacteria bacterium]|nr:hypothetical protein [Actinomycetota bacterium]
MKRTSLAVIAAAIACLSLAGCAASTVNDVSAAGGGTNATNGDISLRNILIVSDGSKTALSGAVINNAQDGDKVTGVDLIQADGRVVPAAKGAIAIPPRGAVYYGATTTGRDLNPALALSLKGQPGGIVTLVFTFEEAGDVKIQAPVVSAVGEYAATLKDAK